MSESACNFNIEANIDDGSCEFPDGCTDENAINYNPDASCDNGSCEFITVDQILFMDACPNQLVIIIKKLILMMGVVNFQMDVQMKMR